MIHFFESRCLCKVIFIMGMMNMLGYVGYELLFSLPLVGFICLIIFAFGGTKNINVKNFARSYLLMALIALIIYSLVVVILLFFSVNRNSIVNEINNFWNSFYN